MARHETRKVGDGGDVVIPKSMREKLGIEPGDEVEFEESERGVMLRRAEEARGRERRER